jgi:NAD(P)-dependent dehydrogenase (short-subunit alcohol dehydrogenase family)
MDLNNAVCIVTGSATGIGAACALDAAKKGARVLINYTKSEADAAATVDSCKRLGVEALLVRADVSNDADCQRIARAALDQWGRIDALVNNAGITKFAPNHADLDALQAEDFQRLYAVNVVGAFQMTRAVTPAMKRQGSGAIVNISSVAGVMGVGSSIAYAASKGALNTLTLSLARALAPEIRVNAVCPGFVETRWFKDALGEEAYRSAKARYEERSALRKTMSPEDVARAVTWLLEGADRVTGEFIMVDSGTHLGASPLKAR